ncbi:hypothetical protein JVX93_23580 [Mycolicibacterium boenickei]|nr:hypothetical protein JVX93_23580 [Mycolicibacterium boenickei]
MSAAISVEWGSRSRRLQSGLRQKVSGPSFWLLPVTSPVQFGIVPAEHVADWATAGTVSLGVSTDMNNLSASVTIPDGPLHIRLDFDLTATAGGNTTTVLSFKQLFTMVAGSPAAAGTPLASQFAIDDVVLMPTPSGPVKAKGPSPTGRRIMIGLHPLLSLAGYGKYAVNAEFVDVTELWWKVHPDSTWGWYRNPLLKGRQEHLRVLASTSGGNPMIWFAAIPDTLVGGGTSGTLPAPPANAEAADIVFFRPPPGSNAFPYTPTQQGFEAKQHDDTTMINLARYLLSPVPDAQLPSLQAAGLRSPELLTDRIQPKATSPSIQPANPMSLMKLFDATGARPDAFTDGRANAFRPVGLETAVQQSGGNHLLLVPLGFEASTGDPKRGIPGNPQGGYEAAERANLKTRVASVVNLLWSINALGRDQNTAPNTRERQLWVVGHSEGNRSVWRTLRTNLADIDRIVSFDSDTLSDGIDAMRTAGKGRKKEKPMHAFVVVTPNNGDATGLPVSRDEDLRRLRKDNVLVTVMPSFDERERYWHLNPPPIVNPYLLFLLDKWNVPASTTTTKTLLDAAVTTPRDWNFLFFHELAVFGGEFVQPPRASGTPQPPRLRTFFEQSLGAPNPRPPMP